MAADDEIAQRGGDLQRGGSGLPVGVRRVLVVGASRTGSAVAALLQRHGYQVTLSDRRPAEDLVGAPALVAAGVRVLTGAQGEEQLDEVDLLVKSPGVPGEVPMVEGARRRGIPVWSEVELAYRLVANPFSAVTGTNGKTTTTALLGHMFQTAGMPVRILGNIGTAITSVLGELVGSEELVVELSSFQLEDVVDFRPAAGALLNVTEDHLDRHLTMERYLDCKAKLFARQGAEEWAVLNRDDPRVAHLGAELGERAGGPRVAYFSVAWGASGGGAASGGRMGGSGGGFLEGVDAPTSWMEAGHLVLFGERSLAVDELTLRGLHNVENVLAAATVALARGVPRLAVEQALRTFPGVPHRLQRAGEIDGVAYVNDSKATNVEAALKALDAYPRGTHLILGGRDKAGDYRPLARACEGRCVAVYLVGEAAPLIADAFAGVRAEVGPPGAPVPRDYGDLERALRAARSAAAPGETVLLAPACASFDQYRDFEERGEHFMTLVERLRTESA